MQLAKLLRRRKRLSIEKSGPKQAHVDLQARNTAPNAAPVGVFQATVSASPLPNFRRSPVMNGADTTECPGKDMRLARTRMLLDAELQTAFRCVRAR